MKTVLILMQALADETRLRILMALRQTELCVCQIQALLKLAPSTVSVHMRILHHAGMVEKRRQGKWVFFRLAGREAPPESQAAFRLIDRALADCLKVSTDRKHLDKLLCRPLEEVCRDNKNQRHSSRPPCA